ncbi:uncharacterized protein KLLA0_F13981g [Kluyveromyces lactis]|uniref:KLLA0F13981p n=1 Tax=Kluyveromyces lactis (strain ATCC 8585 / CBS 2359 / DSM 70799 / NBRC 1267 / NRRL Y-1140 / WM37) TaxID=284590 RepID=B5FVA2_KLULA|nr:uncharacterized protein KLLA0_F13981g [Kluyveromyces lactis]CAR64397.1 KLLA0F13981p [Kluyveromyces lactis]|eukprot:XP_002999431.1 uncharacterized protein KLLA0_F13981g [Kluyveromyces lactis]
MAPGLTSRHFENVVIVRIQLVPPMMSQVAHCAVFNNNISDSSPISKIMTYGFNFSLLKAWNHLIQPAKMVQVRFKDN